MAEAKITLTLKPVEFDLLRKTIEERANFERTTRTNVIGGKSRRESMQLEAQLRDLLARLT